MWLSRFRASRINRRAVKWLIELDAAEKVEDVSPRLETWLAESPKHRVAFLSHQKTWTGLKELKPTYLSPENEKRNPPSRHSMKGIKRLTR
jgi:ferric-dicitrate binding protein FerR (iron transport regulator)